MKKPLRRGASRDFANQSPKSAQNTEGPAPIVERLSKARGKGKDATSENYDIDQVLISLWEDDRLDERIDTGMLKVKKRMYLTQDAFMEISFARSEAISNLGKSMATEKAIHDFIRSGRGGVSTKPSAKNLFGMPTTVSVMTLTLLQRQEKSSEV